MHGHMNVRLEYLFVSYKMVNRSWKSTIHQLPNLVSLLSQQFSEEMLAY